MKFLLTVAFSSWPALAQACAVCFGGGTSDLTRGLYWGTLILLCLPFLMAGAMVAFIAYTARRNRVK